MYHMKSSINNNNIYIICCICVCFTCMYEIVISPEYHMYNMCAHSLIFVWSTYRPKLVNKNVKPIENTWVDIR